jgi:hypothetical protein
VVNKLKAILPQLEESFKFAFDGIGVDDEYIVLESKLIKPILD